MRAQIPFPDISPELFSVSLFGMELALRWYALAYIVGILIGWRIVVAAVRNTRLWPSSAPPITERQTEDFLTWAIIGVILGGRFGYVLFYKSEHYFQNPGEILQIWTGGMAFHGGMLGVVLAGLLFAQKHNVPRWQFADAIVLGVTPGLLMGRIANFINGELWGRPTELPWGVVFPSYAAQDCAQPLGLICARHPSQLYEAIFEGLILGGLLLWLAWRRDALKSPGRITGVFFAGYGLTRFIVEFFRQPDAHFITLGNPLGLAIQTSGYGITMGQVLSLPMLMFGLWFVYRSKP
ncbi:prolipoprotein diacylglyceryl transferase [Pseudopelagicola sp. nBUS_20]|uniref:prolipoprotein diacylglyceryl transferase n=1 Tax=Pseudopelagicola sp. nBUS_20 TaxID=3395317 RepID=UPI003EBE29A3